MSRVGIFGGTFDPIHLGHLISAQALRELRNLEKIIFIPAFVSPHKTNIRSLKPNHRLEMVQLSIEEIPYFDYSDIEIKSGAISYTVDTLRILKRQYDNMELIIGYDNIFEFNTWKEPDEILKLAKLIVLKRKTSIDPKRKDKYFNSAVFVETPEIDISSSEIRERIANNLPISFLVPGKVREYIYKHKLYMEENT